MTPRRPLFLLLALLVGFAALVVFTWPQLPERMATHFGAGGQADGWMSRAVGAWGLYFTAVGVAGFVVGMMYAMRFFPPNTMNVPNRDYWFAPEHREGSFAFLLRWGLWFACWKVALAAALYCLIVQANLTTPPRLDNGTVGGLSGAFLAGTAAWIVALLVHFYRKPTIPR
jgi:serine/threonine-protein kinase